MYTTTLLQDLLTLVLAVGYLMSVALKDYIWQSEQIRKNRVHKIMGKRGNTPVLVHWPCNITLASLVCVTTVTPVFCIPCKAEILVAGRCWGQRWLVRNFLPMYT